MTKTCVVRLPLAPTTPPTEAATEIPVVSPPVVAVTVTAVAASLTNAVRVAVAPTVVLLVAAKTIPVFRLEIMLLACAVALATKLIAVERLALLDARLFAVAATCKLVVNPALALVTVTPEAPKAALVETNVEELVTTLKAEPDNPIAVLIDPFDELDTPMAAMGRI